MSRCLYSNEVSPSAATIVASTPLSSCTSRRAVSAGVSPGSMCPFGNTQSCGARRARTIRNTTRPPRSDRTTPPAWVNSEFTMCNGQSTKLQSAAAGAGTEQGDQQRDDRPADGDVDEHAGVAVGAEQERDNQRAERVAE